MYGTVIGNHAGIVSIHYQNLVSMVMYCVGRTHTSTCSENISGEQAEVQLVSVCECLTHAVSDSPPCPVEQHTDDSGHQHHRNDNEEEKDWDNNGNCLLIIITAAAGTGFWPGYTTTWPRVEGL